MVKDTYFIFELDRYRGEIEAPNTKEAKYLERHTSIEAITIPSRTNYPTTAVAEIVSIEVETSDRTDCFKDVLGEDWSAERALDEYLHLRATQIEVCPDGVRVPSEEEERNWGWFPNVNAVDSIKFSIDIYYRINRCMDNSESRCQEVFTHIDAVTESIANVTPTAALAKVTHSFELDKDITEDLMRLPEPKRERAMSDYCCMKIRVQPVLKE